MCVCVCVSVMHKQIEAGLVEEAVATLAAEMMQESEDRDSSVDPLVARELAQGCLTLAYKQLAEGFR